MHSPQPKKARGLLRLIAFFLLPALFTFAANRLLLQTDAHAYFTLRELTQREDIELALVGSSVVGYNFDPEIISEKTGLTTFNASIGMVSLPSALAITRLLLSSNTPQYVALVLDPSNLTSPQEDIQAQLRVSPFIKNPLDRLAYYLELAGLDGKYIDRLFLFKTMCVQSLHDVRKTLEIRADPRGYYERNGFAERTVRYKGQGHVEVNLTPRWGKLLSDTSIRPYQVSDHEGLYPYSERKILEFVRLCRESGAKPIVMIGPDLTAHRLAEIGYMDKSVALAKFCREQGIEFFDFSIARPEFIPRLDDYYYDFFHLNAEGSRLFSRKFADFMTLYLAGEPVDHLFYASQQDCLEHMDFITNAWFTIEPQSDALVLDAASNRGPNVTPEYAFMYEAPDGTQTLLRDYDAESAVRVPRDQAPSPGKITVYARPREDPQQRAVFYSQEI